VLNVSGSISSAAASAARRFASDAARSDASAAKAARRRRQRRRRLLHSPRDEQVAPPRQVARQRLDAHDAVLVQPRAVVRARCSARPRQERVVVHATPTRSAIQPGDLAPRRRRCAA
jgi:hypothetical protein